MTRSVRGPSGPPERGRGLMLIHGEERAVGKRPRRLGSW
jgi:hypothetical protein